MKIFYFIISKCFFLAFIFYTAFAQGSTTCTTGSSTDGDGNTCFQACGCDAYSMNEVVECSNCGAHHVNNPNLTCIPERGTGDCNCSNTIEESTLACPTSCLGQTYKLNTNIPVTAGGSCPNKATANYTCDATGNQDPVCPFCASAQRKNSGDICCQNGSEVSSTVVGVDCCPSSSTPHTGTTCPAPPAARECSANETYLNKNTHKCCWNADSGNSGVVDDGDLGSSYTDGLITCNTDPVTGFSPNMTQQCGCETGYVARCVVGARRICGTQEGGWTCMGTSGVASTASHSKCCKVGNNTTCVESSACDRDENSANTHYCCPDKSTPTEQGDECPSACPAGQELGNDQICCNGSSQETAVDGCCPSGSTPYTGSVCDPNPTCGTATLTTGQACCKKSSTPDPSDIVYNTSTQGCCANETNDRTVYNISTQGCCNNESPNLPTVYSKSSSSEGSCGTAEKCWSTSANTACCGTGDDAEVYSTASSANKSCCGTGANAEVYSTATADNKSCCGTGASAEVYSTAAADNQSCCKKSSTPGSSDDVYNTSTQGCCNHQTSNAELYDIQLKECCGASNPKTVVDSGTCTFCNGVQFDSNTQDCCCETTIYPKNTKGCCNTEDVCYGVFNPSTHLCCQNTGVTPITPSRCVSTPSACKSVPSLCHSHKPIRKYVSISDPKDFAFRSNVSMVGRKYYRSRFTVGRADRPDYICHKLDASGNIVEGGFLPQYLCPSLTICPYGTQCACTKSTGESVKDTRCEYAYVNPLRDSGSRTENQQSPHTFHGFETIVIQKVEP